MNTEYDGKTKEGQVTQPKGKREWCRGPGELSSEVVHSFIHSFSSYLLRADHVPDTLLGVRTMAVNKTDEKNNPCSHPCGDGGP